MVTKREIAAAQIALNEAVDSFLSVRWSDQNYYPRLDLTETCADMIDDLKEARDLHRDLRLTLEGEGPAVARATSIAAAKSRLMGKQSLRRDILVMVVAHHNKWQVGMTSEQIQARIPKGTHQTVSARVSELVNTYQLLRDSGRKIDTTSGSKATVWEPTDEARSLVAAQITGREPDA